MRRENHCFKVVLVNPPPFEILEPEYDTPRFGRPGLAYLAGYLRQREGYSVDIIDAKFERLGFESTLQRTLQKNPDLVGFGAFTCEVRPAAYLANRIKRLNPKIFTVIGGVHVTAIPEQTLQEFPQFDFGVYGEGEVTFSELCEALRNRRVLEDIRGLAVRRENEIVLNPPRERIADQDTIPFPAWDLLPRAEEYILMTQRGCPFNCLFCMNPNGRVARPRSIQNFMEELEMVLNRYRPKEIRFGDELFSVNMDRTHQLLDAMIGAGVHRRVRWYAQTHVHFVDTPLLKKMKQAGARVIGVGIETGDAEILRQMGKGTTREMILKAVHAAKEARLPFTTYFILGHPHESIESIKNTIGLAVKINPTFPTFGIMVPYPGTEVARLAAQGEGGYRLRSTNWDDYDKQIGGALEFAGLSRTAIEKLQLWAYLKVFLGNCRYGDLIKFCWRYRREGFALLKKILSERQEKIEKWRANETEGIENGRPPDRDEIASATRRWQTWQKVDMARLRKTSPHQGEVIFAENQRRQPNE